MRIALYARVSTDDKGQDPENQLRQLRQWASNAGHEIVGEYIDQDSGRKGTAGRKQFAALFEDAHRRKFDTVLFWALDRFSREGMQPTIAYLQRLASYGVAIHSYTEPHLATDNELVRDILLALLSSLAKQESRRMSERTKVGMARARLHGTKSGKPIGCKPIHPTIREAIKTRLGGGETAYRIAKDFGLDPHTVRKYGTTE